MARLNDVWLAVWAQRGCGPALDSQTDDVKLKAVEAARRVPRVASAVVKPV